MSQSKAASVAARTIMGLVLCLFAISTVFYRLFLFHRPEAGAAAAPPWTLSSFALYVVPILIALSMRWLVIPRLRNQLLALIPFMVGVFSAQALTFFGLFLVPRQRFNLFFYTTWGLLLMFIPVWKGKVEPCAAPNGGSATPPQIPAV
jgi:hypothetical protein